MANPTPKPSSQRKTAFLDFHPPQPIEKRSNKFHPYTYTPLASNIKGIFFNSNQCLTPLPKQSNDDINWQIKWMEQLDSVKKEGQAKEEQLKKVIAHKDAEIGKQKTMWKTQADLLKQKADEIEKFKSKCKANDIALKRKSADIARFKLESKAKDEIIDRKTTEAGQYKSKCDELTEIVEQQKANFERLQSVSKARDEIAVQNAAEAQHYKLKCDELVEMVKQKLAESEQFQLQSKARDEIIGTKTAEAEQYKLECKKLAEIVEEKMVEIDRLSKLETKDGICTQNQNTAESNCSATKSPTNYRCPKCSKYFNKKSSLNDHLTETSCAGEKKMDFKCEICDKMFTHRGLVRHLDQFLTNKHTPRGPHAKISTEYIQTLLNSHKSKKK